MSKPSKDSRPVAAALTFIVLLLGLGVPVWWSTTTVQRASLSLDELSNLSPVTGDDHHISLVYKSSNDESNLFQQLKNTKEFLQKLSNIRFSIIHHKLDAEESNIVESLDSIDSIDVSFEKLSRHEQFDGLSIVELPSYSLMPLGQVSFGRHNFLYISSQTDFKTLATVLENFLAIFLKHRDSFKTSLLNSYKNNLLLSLVTTNETIQYPNLISTLDENLEEFSRKISQIADLKIASQVVFIGNRKIGATFNDKLNGFILDEEKLVTLINSLEPRLGSQLSSNPTFHWVYYIPHETQSPLYLYKNSHQVLSNSILSPRWNGGGLQIVNGIEPNFSGLVLRQLREALGIISIEDNMAIPYISHLKYDESGVHGWELYLLRSYRTIEYLNQATITLKSLSHLLKQIGNIVVSEEIRDLIIDAVDKGETSRSALLNGNLIDAYRDALLALKSAEKAFFDPSLLALLYFPEDQKYAIYIPLFLPVGIPVLLSLRSVYQHFFKL